MHQNRKDMEKGEGIRSAEAHNNKYWYKYCLFTISILKLGSCVVHTNIFIIVITMNFINLYFVILSEF